ncbi:DNA-directed RNA polymerase III subunit RPC10-like [Mercurialis annua]|uniref:DNA-directed RNA polymerase III subunit RPC10-like n=1 Tax=Mercurialis annua TaxID=3986 RepID=UPI00215F80CC|nr:DNA-directed RNA polymerase III subunit RPC10-like [Mercurialis annua]XP_055959954.1 DNA-directed RNA polymerase III subunit RPC10-like [Mercurialis annua]
MEFCPTCGILLKYEQPSMGQPSRFYCSTCPYFCSIETRVKIKRKHQLVKKEVEPVFTLADMMKGGSETDNVTCPHCNFGKARFHELQIRSADEPATLFFCCMNDKCSKMWREN